MKKLIYLSNYLKRDYMRTIDLLAKSLSVSGTDLTDTDVLVFTQEDFVEEIKNIFEGYGIDVKTHCLELIYSAIDVKDEEQRNRTRVLDAAQMRMRLFEWDHIGEYDKILYIDTDVLIDGDLSVVFDVISDDILYGLQEGTTAQEYFGRSLFPPKRRDWPVPYRTPTFTTGVLAFNNCDKIRYLFTKTLDHIRKHLLEGREIPSCMEQPFLVYNTIIDGAYNETSLIGLVVNNPNLDGNAPTHVISHFPRPIGNPEKKFLRMSHYLNDKGGN